MTRQIEFEESRDERIRGAESRAMEAERTAKFLFETEVQEKRYIFVI